MMSKHGYIRKRFDEVFDLQMGKTPDRKNLSFFGGNNVWLSIKDMGAKYLSSSNECITDEAIEASGIKKVKKGTVVMSFKLTVGKCGITNCDLFTNEAIMAFNVKSNYNIKPEFLYFYLQGYKWQGANKAVMGLTLNKATISKQFIEIPPIEAQEAIVAELDEINEAIAEMQQQIADLDTLAQSTFYDMFGDPVTNPKGWDIKKLGEVATDKLSYGSGASATSYDGEIRYIRITDIKDNGELNDDVVSPNSIDIKYLLKEGDILFARSGATVGKTYCHSIKNGKCLYAGYLIRMIPNRELVLPVFVFAYTRTNFYRSFVEMSQRAVAQPNINAQQYSNLDIPVPPLTLQQDFAEKVEAIEAAKAELNAQIDEMQTLLASRMDYYFD